MKLNLSHVQKMCPASFSQFGDICINPAAVWWPQWFNNARKGATFVWSDSMWKPRCSRQMCDSVITVMLKGMELRVSLLDINRLYSYCESSITEDSINDVHHYRHMRWISYIFWSYFYILTLRTHIEHVFINFWRPSALKLENSSTVLISLVPCELINIVLYTQSDVLEHSEFLHSLL